MTWWTSAPELTPVAVWDAKGHNANLLIDQVGSNHLVATSELGAMEFLTQSVRGNGDPLLLTAPLTLPEFAVIVAFVKVSHRWVTFAQNTVGGVYLLHYADNGYWYSSNGSSVAHGSMTNVFGTAVFATIVKGASTSQLYVNGVAVGAAVANSYIPATLDKIGHVGNGNEYNLQVTDSFMAAGIWSGTASQADIVALEAAARNEMIGLPATYRTISLDLGIRSMAPAPALDALGVRNYTLLQPMGVLDACFGGNGQITGTVKNTPAMPVKRRVVLIDEFTRTLIRETWSNTISGAYVFERVAMDRTYTVLSYDHTQAFRAVVADRVVPEQMSGALP